MFPKKFLTPLLGLGLTAVAPASVFISDFTGASSGDALPGIDSWSQNQANPTNDTQPLTWVNPIGGGLGAAVGTFYDVPTSDPLSATRPIGVALAGSTLCLDFSIQDSTNLFPGRNDYSFTVANGSGDNLFSLNFGATSQNMAAPALWNVTWDSIGGSGGPAFGAVGDNSIYSLIIDFTPDLGDMDFSLSLQGPVGSPFVETGTLTGLAGASFDDLVVSTTMGLGADWGDNFIVVQGVPEPSSLLLLGLSGLGLLRRRR